ncbi:Mo-dependent nitrogenase C-terminal domain-containing protein [Okeania sp. SIO2C2]|uniref:Mo-dependent nitrogenase C-terminal domain-containing protein n=1 Tax=Okeania sp. SIO2C2 TaxID=2607787 RepID=UPI00338D6331
MNGIFYSRQPEFAKNLCQLIPAQCPFTRDINFWGRIVLKIPPLCKLNPFYYEIISLGFRSLTFLADVCLEDIIPIIKNFAILEFSISKYYLWK